MLCTTGTRIDYDPHRKSYCALQAPAYRKVCCAIQAPAYTTVPTGREIIHGEQSSCAR